MFTAQQLRALLSARPFVPFRLVMSDGGSLEVRSPEQVFVGRHMAIVGLLDPGATGTLFDVFTHFTYLHVTRVEYLVPGAPPSLATTDQGGSPTPSPA